MGALARWPGSRGECQHLAGEKLDALIRSITPFSRPPDLPASGGIIATRGEQHIAVSDRSQRPWRVLYDLLIAPIERELPLARAAPGSRSSRTGPLLGVPFAALRDARGHYLIERYAIHSVPAGASQGTTAGKARADSREGAVLLVGYSAGLPRISGEPPLPRLAGAREEVLSGLRISLRRLRTTMLTGSAAHGAARCSALRGKAVVHLATHGIIRDGKSALLVSGAQCRW